MSDREKSSTQKGRSAEPEAPPVVDPEVIDSDDDSFDLELPVFGTATPADGEPEGAAPIDATPVELDPGDSDAEDLLPLEWLPGSSGELVPVDPLQRYLAEIRHFPTLTREEEHELAARYFNQGDKRAGYKLIVANLRLVVMIAREYQRNVTNVLDLIQEGNIGLLEAVKQYDPFRGIRFPSYAVYWIRAYMLRHLINNIRLVKIGTTQAQRKLFFNLQKEKERLEAEGFIPEAKLLAERLKVKESEVIEMEQRLALPDLSVDAPLGSQEDAGDLHGILPDPSTDVEGRIVEEDFSGAIREAVSEFKLTADEKERTIIDERLFTEEPATLQEIADRFDLSRERIRQIESRLKERLKRFLAERLNLGPEGEVEVGGD